MEFVDEDCVDRPSRPLLQSKPSPPPPPAPPLHRPTLALSLLSAFLILILVFKSSEPFKSLLLWLSVSLLLGPFAPPSLTAGDIRVGIGPPLSRRETPETLPAEKPTRRSSKKSSTSQNPSLKIESSELGGSFEKATNSAPIGNGEPVIAYRSEEWSEGDDELLKKLMAKHPVGKPGRWEDIARGFNGRFKVEFVIQKAKDMGTRNPNDEDSYNKFLKQRKSLDKRVQEQGTDPIETQTKQEIEETKVGNEWCASEDLALLNALKAFPKDAPLRWEKIAASVPGKTKSSCMKRVSELKKNFRSLKGSSTQT